MIRPKRKRRSSSGSVHCVKALIHLCIKSEKIDQNGLSSPTQGDSGDATDDEMVSRKTRSCKEGLYRNGPESDSIDQDDPGL